MYRYSPSSKNCTSFRMKMMKFLRRTLVIKADYWLIWHRKMCLLLQSLIGSTSQYIKLSTHSSRAWEKKLEHLARNFSSDITSLFHHVPTTTYFKCDNQFHEQLNVVPMEDSEKTALTSASRKPTRWFRYMDYTIGIWPHGTLFLASSSQWEGKLIVGQRY